jgi:hypothetical protein
MKMTWLLTPRLEKSNQSHHLLIKQPNTIHLLFAAIYQRYVRILGIEHQLD